MVIVNDSGAIIIGGVVVDKQLFIVKGPLVILIYYSSFMTVKSLDDL